MVSDVLGRSFSLISFKPIVGVSFLTILRFTFVLEFTFSLRMTSNVSSSSWSAASSFWTFFPNLWPTPVSITALGYYLLWRTLVSNILPLRVASSTLEGLFTTGVLTIFRMLILPSFDGVSAMLSAKRDRILDYTMFLTWMLDSLSRELLFMPNTFMGGTWFIGKFWCWGEPSCMVGDLPAELWRPSCSIARRSIDWFTLLWNVLRFLGDAKSLKGEMPLDPKLFQQSISVLKPWMLLCRWALSILAFMVGDTGMAFALWTSWRAYLS